MVFGLVSSWFSEFPQKILQKLLSLSYLRHPALGCLRPQLEAHENNIKIRSRSASNKWHSVLSSSELLQGRSLHATNSAIRFGNVKNSQMHFKHFLMFHDFPYFPHQQSAGCLWSSQHQQLPGCCLIRHDVMTNVDLLFDRAPTEVFLTWQNLNLTSPSHIVFEPNRWEGSSNGSTKNDNRLSPEGS